MRGFSYAFLETGGMSFKATGGMRGFSYAFLATGGMRFNAFFGDRRNDFWRREE